MENTEKPFKDILEELTKKQGVSKNTKIILSFIVPKKGGLKSNKSQIKKAINMFIPTKASYETKVRAMMSTRSENDRNMVMVNFINARLLKIQAIKDEMIRLFSPYLDKADRAKFFDDCFPKLDLHQQKIKTGSELEKMVKELQDTWKEFSKFGNTEGIELPEPAKEIRKHFARFERDVKNIRTDIVGKFK